MKLSNFIVTFAFVTYSESSLDQDKNFVNVWKGFIYKKATHEFTNSKIIFMGVFIVGGIVYTTEWELLK